MKTVCLYFQVHQPWRLKKYRFFNMGKDHNYLDDLMNRSIMQKVARQCYLPMNALLLKLIRENKGKFRCSFSITGIAIEQFRTYAPEVLESFKELAATENCIILGRCANYLLIDQPDVRLLRLFIHAPLETRMARVASYSLAWSTHEVARYIRREDKRRAAYYHYYTGEEWRDAAGYDLSLDSQQLGEDGCVELIRNALPLFT